MLGVIQPPDWIIHPLSTSIVLSAFDNHTFLSFAPFRAQGGHCPSWATDLYFAYTSLLLSCRPVETDGFSMVLINLHPNSAQVIDFLHEKEISSPQI